MKIINLGFLTAILSFIPVFLLSNNDTDYSNEKRVLFDSVSIFPLLFNNNLNDINYITGELGLDKFKSNENVLFGVDIRFSIDNIILSYMVANGNSSQERLIKLNDNDFTTHRKLNYSMSIWGVGVGRKIIPSERFILTPSLMGGKGMQILDVATCDNYINIDWSGISDYFSLSTYDNITFKKNYVFLQPKFELAFKITNKISINTECGYLWGFPIDDWKIENMIYSYELGNTPDTDFRGITFSIGPRLLF